MVGDTQVDHSAVSDEIQKLNLITHNCLQSKTIDRIACKDLRELERRAWKIEFNGYQFGKMSFLCWLPRLADTSHLECVLSYRMWESWG